jgi:hypothetical protein
MPWKQGYTISNERSIADADITWPDAARCCLSVTLDLSFARGPEGITAKDLCTEDAYFALNDGLDQVLAVLARHRIRATVAAPAILAAIVPERLRAIAAGGHEIAAAGFRHEDPSALPRAEEAARIAAATELLAGALGSRPQGWFSLPRPEDPFAGGTISADTMDLLLDAGYAWFGNGLADDAPHYWVTDSATQRAILALPYYYHFDDQFFLMYPAKGTGLEHADSLFRNWRAELAAQYKRGRHFSMTIHPQGSGFAHRALLLDRFLAHATSHPGLWNPTGSECAAHWRETYPPETHLNLEPSIWADHDGSLS